MEQEENQQFPSPLPVLPRLDRLDRMLQYLEEKHSPSGRHSSSPAVKKMEEAEDPPCRAILSALEEVHHKGTLMERIAMLEDRVLQLSLEMDERNTSRSSSSTIQVPEEIQKEADAVAESSLSKPQSCKNSSTRPKLVRKWIKCFQMGC